MEFQAESKTEDRRLMTQLEDSQLRVVFALAPSLHSFWSYFSTDFQ